MKKYKVKWSRERVQFLASVLEDRRPIEECTGHASMMVHIVLTGIEKQLKTRLADWERKAYQITFSPEQSLALLLYAEAALSHLEVGTYEGVFFQTIFHDTYKIFPLKTTKQQWTKH